MKSNQNKVLIIVFGALVVVVLGIFFIANSGGSGGGGGGVPSGGTPTANNGTSAQPKTPKDVSQVTLDASFDAETSPDVPTVTEVRQEMRSRGFENYTVNSAYSIGGEFLGYEVIEGDSGDKHPTYVIEYVAKNNNPWFIYVINGCYFAVPLFEVNRSPTDAEIIVSETDFLTQYNGDDNTYINLVPGANEVIVIRVPVIDEVTLDSLTAKELEKR